MVIISYRTIRDYIESHKEVEDQLNNWFGTHKEYDKLNLEEL